MSGPWEQAFWFSVAGDVQSKSNHRNGDRRGGHSVWTFLAGYELAVKNAARAHRPDGWDQGSRSVAVAARPKVLVFCFARSLLDVGNIDKSVLDALQGVVMVTDAQVCWATNAGLRTSKQPGILVGVARLAPAASLAAQACAGAALAEQSAALLTD